MIKLSEIIKVPIEIGDTVLGGKFKNKRIVVKSIGKNDKGDITINNKPMMKFRILPKEESTTKMKPNTAMVYKSKGGYMMKVMTKGAIYNIEIDGKDEKHARLFGIKYLKRNFPKVVLGEGEGKGKGELYKMYTQAMKMMPDSPKQKELIKKITALRKKLKMNEALGPSDEARRYMMLQLYGSNFVTNYKRLLNGIKNEKSGVIKKSWKDFQAIYNQIEKEIKQII
jgi:hypothetical protein